ncbi:copper resistance protein C [Acrocarpospora corrugata]|uniref:Copper resistance protein C n=1 Tax=Acrocarpospora corrugata TaxID=35763 RepID=A0A5M3VTW5_9ACTN|nr:copper resistance CopC family protein [Acrocarpospora corrugata]GER98532.1 copper resistance protein C [Acrocarpospora corrugata]
MRRLITVLLLTGVAVITAPPAAQAHNVLLGSDPGKGATLTAPPTEIRLTFDQPVRAEFAKIALTDAAGAHYESGTLTVEKNDVIAPVSALTTAGTYTIGYQILSNDGHPVTGNITFTFTYATGAQPAAAATAPTIAPAAPAGAILPAGGGSWVWGLLAATAALLALTVRVLARHDRNLRGTA